MNTTQIQTQIPNHIELTKSTQDSRVESVSNTNMIKASMTISIEDKDNYQFESISTEFASPGDQNNSFFSPVSYEDINYLANNEISIGDISRPIVIMTYDDGGPAEYIEHIMSVYEEFNFQATFFITGVWAERNLDLVKEMIDRGFIIGYHGWDHSEMTALSEEAVRKQIVDFL